MTKAPSVQLNKQVVLKARQGTENAIGEVEYSWAELGTVWAEVRPLTGTVLIAAQAETSRADFNVTIRFRSDVFALTTRVAFDGREFEVVHTSEPFNTRNQWVRMLVREARHAG
jgi:SPP1 family predicted phage head-tail adaptor